MLLSQSAVFPPCQQEMPCSFNLLAEMATVKSDRRTDKSCSIGSTGIFLLLVANCQFVGKFIFQVRNTI